MVSPDGKSPHRPEVVRDEQCFVWCSPHCLPRTASLLSSCEWLQEMVSSVCVSVSELEAAEAVATLLLHWQHTNKASLSEDRDISNIT